MKLKELIKPSILKEFNKFLSTHELTMSDFRNKMDDSSREHMLKKFEYVSGHKEDDIKKCIK